MEKDFGARQRSDVTEVTFISLLWVRSKALKSVHHTEDSNKSTLNITEEWEKKNIEERLALFPLLLPLDVAIPTHLELVLKRHLKGFCPPLVSNSKYSQNVCWSRKPAGFPSKGFFFPQFRKVMGLVPHANKEDTKEVICFHTFPTSNKRQLAYRW